MHEAALFREFGLSLPFGIAGALFFIALFYWGFTFSFSRMALRYEKSIGLGEH